MIFQHDGASAHFRRDMRDYFNEFIDMRWIGKGSSFHLPPRSLDLTPYEYLCRDM